MLRLDCCGLLCALLVYGCMLYADYVVVGWLVLPTMMDRWVAFVVGRLHECLLGNLEPDVVLRPDKLGRDEWLGCGCLLQYSDAF